jgi:hypothetical protein
MRFNKIDYLAYAIIGAITAANVSLPAHADEASKNAKLHELASLRGLKQILNIQNNISVINMKLDMKKVVENLLSGTKITEENKKTIIEIAQRYINNATKPIDYDDAERSWCIYYGENITEEELDEIISFYKSPIGTKDIQAELKLQSDWTNELSEKRLKIMNKAMSSYIIDLKTFFASLPANVK